MILNTMTGTFASIPQVPGRDQGDAALFFTYDMTI